MRSNSSILSRKSSRGRKGDERQFRHRHLRPASRAGGGMVKCTRSTEASDFRRFRQVRSPAWGSPDTRSTRSRSRHAVDLDDGGIVAVGQFGPPALRHGELHPRWPRRGGSVSAGRAARPRARRSSAPSPPSMEISSGAGGGLPGAAPWSSTMSVSVTGSPMIAKAGAFSTTRRAVPSRPRGR